MSLLDDLRARERAERSSTIEHDLQGGSIPALRRPARAVTAVQEVGGRAGALTPGGEVCSLRAVDVAVSTTATTVEFTETVGEQSWRADLALPSTDVVPSFKDAYYDVQVELVRGSFAGTVEVEILRGDTVVWDKTMSPYWADPQVPVTAKGRLTKEA